jgi:hypothetical protein
MSLRTTPNRTGSTTSPRLYPASSTISPVTAPIPVTGPETAPAPEMAPAPETAPAPNDASIDLQDPPPTADPKPDARAETMRALRIARRRRRHLMMGCAVVIAICVVVTLLIVGIARDRRPGSQVVLSGVAPVVWHRAAEPVVNSPHAANAAVPSNRSITNPDAQASEGAQP